MLTREGSSNGLGPEELLLFRQMLTISQNITENSEHKLIILANKVTDLPMWLTDEITNPFVKRLTVERPSESNKKAFFDMMIEDMSFGEAFDRRYREEIALKPGQVLKPGETETEAE